MKSILFIATGGAIGSVMRYLISLGLKPESGIVFPIHTFTINIVGCFVIGLVWAFAQKYTVPESILLFSMVGVLGGFTTFSSFGLETFQLIKEKAFSTAIWYILSSNILGLLSVYLGYMTFKLAS